MVQIHPRPHSKRVLSSGAERLLDTQKVGGSNPPAPTKMKIDLIYQDKDLLVVNKPPGITVFPEGKETDKTLIDYLILKYPELKQAGIAPRYGIIHRLDKDTSGVLLIAKNNNSLDFFQKQFKDRRVYKEYIALCQGIISEKQGKIETLIGRSPKDRRKQKAFSPYEIKQKGTLRSAITNYEVLQNFQNYTLIKVIVKTGRKHQIRCHMAHINHPLVGDKLYGFRDALELKGLTRQFLHAKSIKVNNHIFSAELPDDLKKVIDNIK